MTKIYFLISVILVNLGCANSPYKNTLRATAAGVAVGALYGSGREEFKSQNTVLYGAVAGLAAGAAALVFDVDGADQEKIKEENAALKLKLNEFQKKLEPKLVGSGNSLFASPLPKEMSGLVEPGEWKRYKLDQWVQDPYQANIWYRQIEMFEIIPPTTK